MDNNAIERERSIPILAQNCAVGWRGTHINIVDTPAMPTSAVRWSALSMVDGVLLLIDAQEGPMPQTRFVTRRRWRWASSPSWWSTRSTSPARGLTVINAAFVIRQAGCERRTARLPGRLRLRHQWLELAARASRANNEAGHGAAVRTISNTCRRTRATNGPLQLQVSAGLLDLRPAASASDASTPARSGGQDVLVMAGEAPATRRVSMKC